MKKYLILAYLLTCHAIAYGFLAGGRPNSFSGGDNAFAGIVNPANAVWIPDRIDIGVFWFHQESSINNRDNNVLFPKGKTDLTYRTKNTIIPDIAIHKHITFNSCLKENESSFSLAAYTTPSLVRIRTKRPIAIIGTTPIKVYDRVQVISAIFSFKLNPSHSIGISLDYFYFSHIRNGFQNSDNPLRSVSPGHVTNKGMDHSGGLGLTIGWRWKISDSLDFGIAWARKSYCGQFRKYRGYEPHHAKNFIPQTIGAGFTYKFTQRFAGRLEVLWSNQGNLPNANNNILSDGSLNLHKRGSDKSPGPGLQDATYINAGLGYKVNSHLFLGIGYSHRIKLPRSSNYISHSYTHQTVYDILTLGANMKYQKHDLLVSCSYGFKNRETGHMPQEIGGGQFRSEKQIFSVSVSWGYLF